MNSCYLRYQFIMRNYRYESYLRGILFWLTSNLDLEIKFVYLDSLVEVFENQSLHALNMCV